MRGGDTKENRPNSDNNNDMDASSTSTTTATTEGASTTNMNTTSSRYEDLTTPPWGVQGRNTVLGMTALLSQIVSYRIVCIELIPRTEGSLLNRFLFSIAHEKLTGSLGGIPFFKLCST